MINFIVCEDNKIILQKNLDIINKLMFNNNVDYKIYPFIEYNDELKKIISNEQERKIYILDVELSNVSGIDIAREIRNVDKSSFIIISTVHTEYLPFALKSKLLIYDFVSKFDDYEITMENILSDIVHSYPENKILNIKFHKKIINIDFGDILFIKYNKEKRKTVIKTKNNLYEVNMPLKTIICNLDNRFNKKNGFFINADNIEEAYMYINI